MDKKDLEKLFYDNADLTDEQTDELLKKIHKEYPDFILMQNHATVKALVDEFPPYPDDVKRILIQAAAEEDLDIIEIFLPKAVFKNEEFPPLMVEEDLEIFHEILSLEKLDPIKVMMRYINDSPDIEEDMKKHFQIEFEKIGW